MKLPRWRLAGSAIGRLAHSVHTIVNAARMSVPIAFRITMAMKIKDLPTAASFTFEGACATLSGVLFLNFGHLFGVELF